MKYCVHCGGEIHAGSRYCHACGQPLPAFPAGGKRRFWSYFFGALFLVLILWLLYGLFSPKSLAPVVEKEMAAIREGRITEAYYAFTSKDFQTSTTLSAFREFINSHPILAQNSSLEVSSSTLDEKNGKVIGILSAQSGEKVEVEFRLIKEEGEWKVSTIQVQEKKSAAPATDAEEIRSLVSQQLQMLRDEEAAAAYYTYASKRFRKLAPLSAFQELIGSSPLFCENESIVVERLVVDGDEAAALATLKRGEEKLSVEYAFHREGGWKVHKMQVVREEDLDEEHYKLFTMGIE